jgi:hypothetical protein
MDQQQLFHNININDRVKRMPVQILFFKTYILFAIRHLRNTGKKVAKKLHFCPEYKVLCLGQIIIFPSMVVAASCYGYTFIGKGVFQDKRKNRIELSTGKILQ